MCRCRFRNWQQKLRRCRFKKSEAKIALRRYQFSKSEAKTVSLPIQKSTAMMESSIIYIYIYTHTHIGCLHHHTSLSSNLYLYFKGHQLCPKFCFLRKGIIETTLSCIFGLPPQLDHAPRYSIRIFFGDEAMWKKVGFYKEMFSCRIFEISKLFST